jgi:hypothetical protein
MELLKFKIHSIVDVITNSSTTIYTFQGDSVEPAKELINEMLKLSGITDKTADDIFYFGVFKDTDDLRYGDCEEFDGKSDEFITNQVNQDMVGYLSGNIEKPEYFKYLESDDDDYANGNTYLYLIPRDEKYKEFGDKIKKLLNSVDAQEGEN